MLQTIITCNRVDRTVHQMEQQGAAQRRKSKSGDARDGGRREHGDQRIADAMDTLHTQHCTSATRKPRPTAATAIMGERARIGGGRQGKSCGLNELFWHARTCVARRRQSSTWRRSMSLIWKLHRSDAHHGCRRYRGAPWLFAYFIACALLAHVTALNFLLPMFLFEKRQPRQRQLVNASGRIVGTARLIAFCEPRERYQEGDAKVIAVGFIFALETSVLSSSGKTAGGGSRAVSVCRSYA